MAATRNRPTAINIIIPQVAHYTVADSLSYTRRIATYLIERGIKPGDRLAIIAANSPLHLWLHTACAWIGAVTVIINPRLSATEISTMLADSGAKLAFFDEKSQIRYKTQASSSGQILPLPTLAELFSYDEITTAPLPCPAGKVAALLYTSGSAGKPKGVVLTHENLYWGSQNFRNGFHYHPHRDIEAVAAPISHIGGFNGTTLDIFSNGGTIIMFPDFKPDFILENLEKYQVNVMFLVPTMYWMLTQSKLWQSVNLSTWRLPLIGGDSITDELAQILFRKGLRPVHVWGMTELSASGSCIRLKPTSPTTTSIGLPFVYNHLEIYTNGACRKNNGESNILPVPYVPHSNPPIANETEKSVPDWGEFFVSGPAVSPGYWNSDAVIKLDNEGLWAVPRELPLPTGDVGFFDKNHLLFLMARKNRLITRGGETFSPLEVEYPLKGHSDIIDLAIVGVPHWFWGEEICAALVPSSDLIERLRSKSLTNDGSNTAGVFNQVFDLREHDFLASLLAGAAKKIAKWKLPTKVILLQSLPQTSVGKIDHAQIKFLFS